MSDSVRKLLGCEIFVRPKCSAGVPPSVHLMKPGRVECSFHSISILEFHSAEHLSDSVRGLYQSEFCSYFRFVFAFTLVVVGTKCCVNRDLCLFFLSRCMCGLGPLVILGVDVSAQSTVVSRFARFD